MLANVCVLSFCGHFLTMEISRYVVNVCLYVVYIYRHDRSFFSVSLSLSLSLQRFTSAVQKSTLDHVATTTT